MDDTDPRDTLVEQLSLHDEFEASLPSTPAQREHRGIGQFARSRADDVDFRIPTAAEVVRSLRKGGFKAPIIMLTGTYGFGHHSRAGIRRPTIRRQAVSFCGAVARIRRNCDSTKPARTRCSRRSLQSGWAKC